MHHEMSLCSMIHSEVAVLLRCRYRSWKMEALLMAWLFAIVLQLISAALVALIEA